MDVVGGLLLGLCLGYWLALFVSGGVTIEIDGRRVVGKDDER